MVSTDGVWMQHTNTSPDAESYLISGRGRSATDWSVHTQKRKTQRIDRDLRLKQLSGWKDAESAPGGIFLEVKDRFTVFVQFDGAFLKLMR